MSDCANWQRRSIFGFNSRWRAGRITWEAAQHKRVLNEVIESVWNDAFPRSKLVPPVLWRFNAFTHLIEQACPRLEKNLIGVIGLPDKSDLKLQVTRQISWAKNYKSLRFLFLVWSPYNFASLAVFKTENLSPSYMDKPLTHMPLHSVQITRSIKFSIAFSIS